jgi:protein-L-isoaspartate(D-aspartate) O-methyltransferase
MAELTQDQRQEWLASLARRVLSNEGNRAGDREGDRAGGEGGKSWRGKGSAGQEPPVWQELHEVARACRLGLIASVDKHFGPFDPRLQAALLEVGRERFVRPEDVARSADDAPLALDDGGLATISAPHAYLLSYRLLRLTQGDRLVELGTGSGYGAALAAQIVGPEGSVLSFEIDGALAAWAVRSLAREPAAATGNVRVVELDAIESAGRWEGRSKVVVTFAVDALPQEWLLALPEGGMLVAPVGPRDQDQRLVLATRRKGRILETDHGTVRYVRNRSGSDIRRR